MLYGSQVEGAVFPVLVNLNRLSIAVGLTLANENTIHRTLTYLCQVLLYAGDSEAIFVRGNDAGFNGVIKGVAHIRVGAAVKVGVDYTVKYTLDVH